MPTPLDGAAFEFVTAAAMSDFEVLIVGGGIAGASLGAEIAGKRRTLIIEAEAQCGYHSTGRSAAFWLESYGGEQVALLTAASRAFLDDPPGGFFRPRLSARPRGAAHFAKASWPEVPPSVDRAASRARRTGARWSRESGRDWTKALFEPGCADIDVAALHAAFLRKFRRAGGDGR